MNLSLHRGFSKQFCYPIATRVMTNLKRRTLKTRLELRTISDTERPRQKGGQPSIVSKFPEIVDQVSEFIKQHGFSAQNRRRTEIVYSNGVTDKQIQEHLYNLYPTLKQHKI